MLKNIVSKKNKIALYCFIPSEINDKLKSLKEKGYSITEIVIDALKEYFKKEEINE